MLASHVSKMKASSSFAVGFSVLRQCLATFKREILKLNETTAMLSTLSPSLKTLSGKKTHREDVCSVVV